jgi:hypothetical protein
MKTAERTNAHHAQTAPRPVRDDWNIERPLTAQEKQWAQATFNQMVQMRDEYDFSKARKNPYVCRHNSAP